MQPNLTPVEIRLNRAISARDAGMLDEAETQARSAALIGAKFRPEAQIIQATVAKLRGDWKKVEALAAAALAERNLPWLALLRAEAMLMQGKWTAGWEAFDRCRFALPQFNITQPQITRLLWRGEPLHGKRVLIYPEQGLGDSIQFVRYAPLLAGVCKEVYLGTHLALRRLFEPLGLPMFVSGETVPDVDFILPIMSLPRAVGVEPIPAPPYLTASVEAAERWRFHAPSLRRHIGLCWRGNAKHPNDANRSMPRDTLTALAGVDALFYSIQKDGEPGAFPSLNFMHPCRDFDDTAAHIAALDLVITVDTSVAHLAGAMGKPVWTLLPKEGLDWRWMAEGDKTPWYPSMRLFRQTTAGDWAEVMGRVREALEAML